MPENEIPDLWPPDTASQTVRTPVSILRAQAAALGRHTSNILEGEITTRPDEERFYHSFDIVVPLFGGYRYRLLTIAHGVMLYPIQVVYGALEVNVPSAGEWAFQLYSESEFVSWLRQKFSSEETQKLLSSLRAQATQGVPAA